MATGAQLADVDALVNVYPGAEPSTPPAAMNTVVMDAYTGRDMKAPPFGTGVIRMTKPRELAGVRA